MSNLEKPGDWSDEQFEAYLGSADDPMDDEPVFEEAEILDLWAGYDGATAEGADSRGTTA